MQSYGSNIFTANVSLCKEMQHNCESIFMLNEINLKLFKKILLIAFA
jgi:hypothetical protein